MTFKSGEFITHVRGLDKTTSDNLKKEFICDVHYTKYGIDITGNRIDFVYRYITENKLSQNVKIHKLILNNPQIITYLN